MHTDSDREELRHLFVPFHINPPIRVHFQSIHAVPLMHCDSVAPGDVSGDRVSGNRATAFSKADEDVINPLDNDPVLGLSLPGCQGLWPTVDGPRKPPGSGCRE